MATEQDYGSIEERKPKKERQRLETLWWAVVLIWAGLVFGAETLGVLPQIGQADAWSWVFLGAGVFAVLGGLFRVSMPDYPNPTTWDWVWGGIFLILGLGGFMAFDIAWPLILILIGGVILINILWRRQ